MKGKLVLLFLVFLCLSRNVEGKAVGKRVKRTVYPGSIYSLVPQSNTQWIDPEQEAAEDMYWYKSKIGESEPQSYASSSRLDEFAEKSNPNHHFVTNYDLESYENLEKMFDFEFVPQDLQNSRQEKYREEKLDSKIKKLKENDGPLESDQVFSHHETDKSKYSSHKAKQDSPEGHLAVHSKGKEKSKTLISMIHSEVNTNPHKRNLQSTTSTTQLPTASQQFEVEHPSDKLTLGSDFGSIPSELIRVSSEILEFNQRNLPAENESDVLNLSESDLKADDMRTPVNENFASSLQENQLSNNHNFDSMINAEDKNLFRMGINQMFEANSDSFVFNPSAQPLEKFQECKTPKNESGSCRYVQHCMLPSILNSIQHFMENVCIIQGRFIGVCCPEFPVQMVLVKWKDQPENFSDRNDSVEIPQDCGIGTNTRIVGGNDADRKAWPWMVALLNNKKQFFCGASLINSQYVLTAAHCTFGTSKNQIVARLGEYDFNDPRDPHDDYRVVEIKRHGQYNSRSLRNDIALLKLEKPVAFNELVKTICLPEAATDYLGNVTTLVGWGHLNGGSGSASDVLQEASFPVISNDQCGTAHRLPIPSSLICAAAVSRDKGACNGDSGGPLMLLDENDHWKVIGIVSWGRRGCNPKFPTVYTRVTHFMDWIRQHTT